MYITQFGGGQKQNIDAPLWQLPKGFGGFTAALLTGVQLTLNHNITQDNRVSLHCRDGVFL